MADIVTLNVGGVIYSTTRDTLTRYPDSTLGAMFCGSHDVTTDDQGRCFIDGDGSLFRYVLNFLRRSELALPADFKELDILGKEAAFYQLQPLVDAIEEAKQERKPERRKIEYLEVGYGSTEFTLRGEKSTIDMVIECVPPGGKPRRVQPSRSGLTRTKSDIIVTDIKLLGSRSASTDPGIQTAAEMVTSLLNILFDMGFTIKSSIKSGWLFERS